MMKSTFVVAIAALSLAGLTATATAAYNTPAKATLIKTQLVVAYACSAPNATQFFSGAGIIAACTPPVATTTMNPANVTTFGPNGFASVLLKEKAGDVKIIIKAKHVLNNGIPANGVNLGSRANRVIVTSGNCTPGLPPQPAPLPGTECTSTDISSVFSSVFSIPCTNGTCTLKTTVNTILPGAISSGGSVNVEIGGIGLTDPDGDLAFTSGLLIR